MEWLKAHDYLAAWLGPAIGVIGLLLQQTSKRGRFNFRAFTIYLTFFVILGVKLSGKTTTSVDIVFGAFSMAILWDYVNPNAPRRKTTKPVDNFAVPTENLTKPQD